MRRSFSLLPGRKKDHHSPDKGSPAAKLGLGLGRLSASRESEPSEASFSGSCKGVLMSVSQVIRRDAALSCVPEVTQSGNQGTAVNLGLGHLTASRESEPSKALLSGSALLQQVNRRPLLHSQSAAMTAVWECRRNLACCMRACGTDADDVWLQAQRRARVRQRTSTRCWRGQEVSLQPQSGPARHTARALTASRCSTCTLASH